MNRLYQQLQPQQQQQINPKLLSKNNLSLKTILNSSNPSELIQNLISQNPKMNNVMQLLQSSGKTPKEFFYQMAKQKGVNPDQFLNSLLQE